MPIDEFKQNTGNPVEIQAEEKTYTEEDVTKILTAKNHEKEARQAAEAKLKELENKIFTLESQKYGDEEKILNSPLYKKLQADFNAMQSSYTSLENERNSLTKRLDADELKAEILKNTDLIPGAADDILMHVQQAGFRKMDGGWLDENGNSVKKFVDGLKDTRPYYFKKARNTEREEIYAKLATVNSSKKRTPDQIWQAAGDISKYFK